MKQKIKIPRKYYWLNNVKESNHLRWEVSITKSEIKEAFIKIEKLKKLIEDREEYLIVLKQLLK